jgi:hypothetical protein
MGSDLYLDPALKRADEGGVKGPIVSLAWQTDVVFEPPRDNGIAAMQNSQNLITA